MRSKKIIILQTSGNELANQLWNYAGILAYSMERGYKVENPSFFEYGNYFANTPAGGIFKALFFSPFTDYTKRKSALKRRIWRKTYFWYVKIVSLFCGKYFLVHHPSNYSPYYLPPSRESQGKLKELENATGNIYMESWLFRNPAGIKKYRHEIVEKLKPRADIENEIDKTISSLRRKFKNLIGLHVRQGDYKTWRGGNYFIPEERAGEIALEYLSEAGLNSAETCFVITSDEKINPEIWSGLNTHISRENAVFDLFLLSKTDAVIGSDSTFGAFASYMGDKPFIVMQKGNMDWEYYRGKKEFFENKYSSLVHY